MLFVLSVLHCMQPAAVGEREISTSVTPPGFGGRRWGKGGGGGVGRGREWTVCKEEKNKGGMGEGRSLVMMMIIIMIIIVVTTITSITTTIVRRRRRRRRRRK